MKMEDITPGAFEKMYSKENIEFMRTMAIVIAFLPLRMQAMMADPITRHMYQNMEDEILNTNSPHYEMWNATSVANAAYIALHTKNPNVEKKCKDLIDGYRRFILKSLYNILKKLDIEISKVTKEEVEKMVKQFFGGIS